MTSANRFTFDVVANDKSTETTDKITASVQRLTSVLQAAASAYAQVEKSQSRLGLNNNAGRAAEQSARQSERAAQQQARSDALAERAASRRAEAENRAAQTRANLVARSMSQEAKAAKQIEDLYARSLSITGKQAASQSSSTEQKIALINKEIARTQALIAIRAQEVTSAQQAASRAIQANRTGGGSSGTTGAGDARASAAAVDALRTAHQRLATAQQQNATASAQLTTVQRQLDQAQRAGAVSLAENEAALNRARYALYQVGAAYGVASRAALTAAESVAKTSIEYEKSFSAIERTSGLGQQIREGVGGASEQAAGQVGVLRNQFVELSRQIPLTFDKLTSIGALGAQLGIGSQDLTEFTTVVAKFAATTNVVAETAAQEFGRLGNLLDVPASKFANLGSAVAQLGVDSVATESEILSVTSEIAAVGSNAGFSAPYVVGLGTALASLRISPYLARGAVGRILQTITRAAADGTEGLSKYAQIIGITGEQAQQLFKESPEQLFTQFIGGLGRAAENGQNLTLTLDALGIKGSQNTRVVTALANSYELLGKYTDESASSFASGTFLDSAFQDVAKNTATALDTMIASFKAFIDSAGSAFLPAISAVANVLNGLFSVLASFPAGVTAGVGALVLAVGVLFAYRSAVAIGSAALLAFKAAGNNLGGGITKLSTIMNVLRANHQAQTTAAVAATGAFEAETIALTGLSAAAARGAVPLGVLAAEQRTIAATSPAAAAGLGATAAGATTVGVASTGAAAGVRGLIAAMGPFSLVFLALATVGGVLLGLNSDLKETETAAAEAAAAQAKLNSTWQESGAGADSLKKAIDADTEAFRASGGAATDANGVYASYKETITDLGNGMERVSTVMTDFATGTERQVSSVDRAKKGYGDLSGAIKDATGQTAPAAAGINEVTGALDTGTVALGNYTREWKASALNEQLLGFFDEGNNKEILKQLQAQFDPQVLQEAIAAGLKGGPAAIAQYFQPLTDTMVTKMAELQKVVDDGNASAIRAGSAVVFDPAIGQAQVKLDALKEQYGLIADLQTKFAQADTAVEAAVIQGQIADAIGNGLGIVGEELDLAGDEMDTFAEKVSAASEQYSAFVDNLFSSTDLAGALAESFEALGESLADNGTDFSNLTDAGRANLSALSDTFQAFAATQDAAIKDGTISAEQAANNTAEFIRSTLAELSNQGVDTSQLDFLNQYLTQITSTNWQTTVDANVNPAVSKLNFLQSYLNSISASFNNVLGAIGRVSGAKVGTVALKAPSTPARSAASVKTPVPTASLNAGLGNARAAREADNLAKANKSAGGAAKKAGQAQKDAADQASEALKKQQEYVKDLAGFYEKLATNAFKSVKAEGDAFRSLQELGSSLVENGKSFNTFTENGRKNMTELTGVFDSFGGTLSAQIEAGTLSADQASAKYREFARGVYGELQSLGVPTQELSGFFRALGVDATGWTGNSGDVQQYSGFITAAADATAKLSKELDEADDYAKKLGEALGKAFDRYYGLGSAVDDVQSAMNGLRQAYQDNIDKVNELRQANNGLSGDLSSAQADKRKAEIERDISTKYGETDRAQKYQADADVAGASVAEIQAKIDANKKEADTLEDGRNKLDGFSDAAIENRGALVDLQSQMLKQIEAYAAAGHTTQEVEQYSRDLAGQFVQVATDAGYTRDQIKGYTGAFDLYTEAIKRVPSSVSTTATADTSQAMAALNAIPKSFTNTTFATYDQGFYQDTVRALNNIPKKGDYVVNVSNSGSISPSVNGGALGTAQGQLNELTRPRSVEISPKVPQGLVPGFSLYRSAVANLGGLIGNQKVTRGFASGGFVPGKSPRDPRVDNLLAKGPGGLFGIRSGEYVVKQPVVNKLGVPFFDALNSGEIPGFSNGGYTGGSGGGGRFASSGIMELSPQDRALLSQIANKMSVQLYADSQMLASSTGRGNVRLNRRGGNS